MSAALSSTMTFSEEQSMLLDVATQFFRERSPVAAVRDQLLSETGFDASLWDEIVQLGWTAIAIPESYGGSELGLAACVAIAEPMGRHLSATPWLTTQLCSEGLRAGGSEEQCAQWLTAIASGSAATVALSEEDGSWDLTGAQLQFTATAAGARLTGVKTLVLNANVAEVALINGTLEGFPAVAILTAEDLAAAAPRQEIVIDETRRSFQLSLADLEIPGERLITGARALATLSAIEQAALLLLSAESAGGTAGVLEIIVEYLNTRTAFGRKIGSYQGLKHPTVDILIGLERARSHVYHCASLIDIGEDPAIALRMAKAQSSDAFAFAGDRAIQFHGGMGFTWECDAHLFLRRALFNQYTFGDAEYHQRALEDLLLTTP